MLDRFNKLKDKYYYDEKAAQWTIDFIQDLRHIEGEWAGQNFILSDWQKDDIIKPVFGLREYKGGPRLIKECYIEIPKKNGKTTLLAAIENYLLFADGEPGAQIYNCAGDDSQADLLFRTAKFMVIADPELKTISKQLRTEIHYENRFIKKLTSKAETKHGINAHGVIYDELHAAQDRELYDTLKYAGSQRRQSIFFQITTAGYDKTSICWDRHTYTESVNLGIYEDDQFWGVIYAADTDDDAFSPETWTKANPMYADSETFRKNFEKDATEAKNNITVLNAFKRLRLNIWTGSEEKWISDKDWMKGDRPLPDLTGKECYAGLDLSSTRDTTALVLAFPVDDIVYLLPFIFVPEEQIGIREAKNQAFYFKWAKEGHLIRTPGNVIDYAYVRKQINECREKYNLLSIGYDPWNAMQLLTEWAEEDGLQLEEYRPREMIEPTKEFDRMIGKGQIIHGGHPVLRWMADNCVTKTNETGITRVVKGTASKDKIDGIIASIMALGEVLRFKEKSQTPMMESI